MERNSLQQDIDQSFQQRALNFEKLMEFCADQFNSSKDEFWIDKFTEFKHAAKSAINQIGT